MLAGELFAPDKWGVPDRQPWPKLLYDAGVTCSTKVTANSVKCDLVTSGITRRSKKSALSGAAFN